MIFFALLSFVEICLSSSAAKWAKPVDSLKTCPTFVLSRNSRRFSTCWEFVPGPSSALAFITLGTACWSFLVLCALAKFIFLQMLQIQTNDKLVFFVKFIFCKYFEHKRHINYIKMQIFQLQVRAVAHSQLRKQLDTFLFCVHLFTSIFGHS